METEYLQIVNKIILNRKFLKLKDEVHHHNTNRYDHLIDVSYRTYKICKRLNLDYISATRAAVLHDFYFDNDFKSERKKMLKHYEVSIVNANKLCKLNEKEKNIIASHMFPIGGKLPKYFESVIVNVVDDCLSIKERVNGDVKRFNYAIKFISLLLMSFISFR